MSVTTGARKGCGVEITPIFAMVVGYAVLISSLMPGVDGDEVVVVVGGMRIAKINKISSADSTSCGILFLIAVGCGSVFRDIC